MTITHVFSNIGLETNYKKFIMKFKEVITCDNQQEITTTENKQDL